MIAALGLAIGLASFTCTPTRPNGTQPPDEVVYSEAFNDGELAAAYRAGRTRPDPHFHGNGAIWTGLPFDGRYRLGRMFLTPEGSIRYKFGWYMAGPDALTVSARRLDADAAPARWVIGTAGGEPRMHPSNVFFPTPGCWEITASTPGSAPLTFVIELQLKDTDR
ncbi:MAG TPA: hypothetical protein VN224_07005 [Xanthomonadales bacterium]|nr:hypothetical protein [Xanthomonadales bacterium]